MPLLYPNYYFIGALLSFIFLAYVCYLLFRVQSPSRANKHLAIAMLSTAAFNLPYIFAHGFYTIPTFIPRLVNYYTPLVAGLHVAVFFLLFPSERSKKAVTIILWSGHLIILTAVGYLAYVMANSPLYYLFNAHLWDSDSLPAQKYVSMLIVLYFLFFISIGVWRGFKEKGEDRWGIWLIVFGFMLGTLPPAVVQVLSRDGLLTRSTFMTTTVIFNIVGFFIALVTYINVTRDRTNLLGRISGIALLTILLVFQAIAYFWLHEKERNFDSIMLGNARMGYMASTLPQHASAFYTYDYIKQKSDKSPLADTYTTEQKFTLDAQATYALHSIANLKMQGPDLLRDALKIIETIATHSPLQAAYLSEFIASKNFTSGKDLADAIVDLRGQQNYRAAKLRQMSAHEVETKLTAAIQTMDKKFPGTLRYINSLPTHTTNETKRMLMLTALTPWHYEGEKLFRGNIYYKDAMASHSIAYQFVDTTHNRVVEVAYPYLLYRKAIAESAWYIVYIIIATYFAMIIGFNIFFRGTLIKPIEEIMRGLTEINNDNLDAHVEIYVEDEIGFMAKSFNKMARSIKAGRMRLQQYAEQLEQKVQERTQELQTTLEDVQTLKAQQDGDYFLTTLLLKPLGVNEVNSERIGIESFVRQKKHFEFRHWAKDIGGDINISHIVELDSRRHIAFINADAMGKSIQGAGGALVLGSVFHTIIERTQATYAMQQLSPERWLKNTFLELHRVFESFDGSMLVSGFFGLIDEESGLMYHIIAEHPRTVLYRNGKAAFITNDRMLRKLGTTSIEGSLGIATTQLEEGDILLLGSDGRDDIILGYDENGNRIINEDENLFLSVVEETKGDLDKIVAKLDSMGEIMDDLSLMRLERFEKARAPRLAFDYAGVLESVKYDLKGGKADAAIQRINSYLKEDPFYPEAIKNLAQIYYRTKNYEKAAEYAQDYLWLKPADAHFVYFASLCFRRVRNYQKSIDLSERLRLREVPLGKNLALLVDLHLRIGNRKRAEALLQELIELDNTFPEIDILRAKLSMAAT
ncbi:MAG TPA: SpoIIE family protein phosphatase [Turneriella sp.]|nr:SpoIIE family protein phosphatase [Turneriella sp.]